MLTKYNFLSKKKRLQKNKDKIETKALTQNYP